MVLLKGVPRSRAKDQVIREAVVVIPIAHAHVSTNTTATITVAPATELTLSISPVFSAKILHPCDLVLTVEDLNERKGGVSVEHRIHISQTEQDRQHHGKPDQAVDTHAGDDRPRDIPRCILDFFRHVY